MSRRSVLGAAIVIVAACASATPTPDGALRGAIQAATAVALVAPPAIPSALVAPPTPSPALARAAPIGASSLSPVGSAGAATGTPPASSAPTGGGGFAASALAPAQDVAVEGRIALVRSDALVVLEGGAARTVFQPPRGGSLKDPAWSPDGRSIAFAYAPPRNPPRAGAPILEQLFKSDVMVVDADGSNLRPAAQSDGPGAILETPAWSSDGLAVLYSYYAPTYKGDQLQSETLEVRRKELAGGGPTTVATSGGGPTVSRDGRAIAYLHESAAEGQSLRIVENGAERVLVRPDRFIGLLAPRFSPDGATIAFSAAMMPTGPGQPQPKASAPLDFLRQLLAPATAYAHGLPWEVWTVSVASGELRQLTQINEDTPYPAWSADGTRLLVYGAGGLHMIDVKAAHTRTLSSEGAHGGMDWRSAG